jgi:DNA polymerase III epsilon subunit-like protein
MKNIMLDLETMGTGPDAAIISIGAVSFEKNFIESRFNEVIDLDSCINAGGIVDASTILWWLTQNEAARKTIAIPGISVLNALKQFNDWCASAGEKKDLLLWGNGSDFDNVILASTYRRMGMASPWYYTNNRCYRTIKNLYPDIKIQRNGIKHNALNDAENQANHLMDIFNQHQIIGRDAKYCVST